MKFSFNKRKEKKQEKEQKAQEVRDHYLAALETSVANTERLEDPARRLLQLMTIRYEVDGVMDDIYEETRKTAVISGSKAKIATNIAGGAAAIALAPVTGGLSIIGLLPVVMAGEFADEKRTGDVEKKRYADDAGYLKALDGVMTQVDERIRDTIDRNVEGISTSPVYGKVMEEPQLAALFSLAAAKYVQDMRVLKAAADAAAKAAPAAKAPAVEADAPAPAEPHEKQDFTRFTQFGRTPPKGPAA